MMNGVVLSQVIGVFLFLGGGVNGFVTPQQQRPTPYAFSRQATPMEIATKSDFENMRSFEQRLAAIEDIAPDILLEFYEPHLNSFSVKPGSVSVSPLLIHTDTRVCGNACHLLLTVASHIFAHRD